MMPLPVSFRRQLTDFHFEKILLAPGALRYLEALLEKRLEDLERLRKLVSAERLNFGLPMAFGDALLAFPEIKKEVDAFLELADVPMPSVAAYRIWDVRIAYPAVALMALGMGFFGASVWLWYHYGGSWVTAVLLLVGIAAGYKIFGAGMAVHCRLAGDFFYNPLARVISVPEEGCCPVRTCQMAGVLAHEYAHYIEDLAGVGGMFSEDLRFFKEGFASGIQRHVAAQRRQKEGNEAFVYHTAETLVSQMQKASSWIRRSLGLPGRKRDERYQEKMGKVRPPEGALSPVGKEAAYAVGSVVFFLLESKYGSGVYKDVVHGRFDFNAVTFSS